MPIEHFEDDAPDEIFRLVMVRVIGGKELRYVNLFSSVDSALNHRSILERRGGHFISLTCYRKVENHDFKKAEKLCGFSEVVPYAEPYPNARN